MRYVMFIPKVAYNHVVLQYRNIVRDLAVAHDFQYRTVLSGHYCRVLYYAPPLG